MIGRATGTDGSRGATAAWCGLVLLVCGWPMAVLLAGAVVGGMGEPPSGVAVGSGVVVGPGVSVFLGTLPWAAGIGLVSTVLGLPLAWSSRGLRAWWSGVLWLPLVLPMPLAYAGLNELRAPGTALGEWLAFRPALSIAAGRAIAVLGLGLWGTSLAAGVLSLGVRQVDAGVFEAARLEGRGAWRRLVLALAMTKGSLAGASVLVGAVMLGSVVPLHLARVPTHATALWLMLDSLRAGESWRVWAAGWPLLVTASAVAVVFTRLLSGSLRRDEAGVGGVGAGGVCVGVSLLIVGCATVLPVGLLARSLSTAQTLAVLWRTEGRAIGWALLVSAVVGAVCAAGCWLSWASRGTRVGMVMVAVALAAALMPGVLVGSAVGAAWRGVPMVSEGAVVLVLAHVARVLVIPAVVGVLLGLSEVRADRERRVLDGATGPTGSLRAGDPGLGGTLVGVGLVCGAMSLSEIEASVQVQPPGLPSVARSMLHLLHFSRYEHLSGLVLMVAAPGVVGVVLWVIVGWARTRRGGPASE